MKIIVIMTVVLFLGCSKKEKLAEQSSTEEISASHAFAAFDQVAAYATATPLKDRIGYSIRIKNVGYSVIEGIAEPRQQWLPHMKNPSDLAEWNEHIPLGDSIATFKIDPGEEFMVVATPQHIKGCSTRFGLLVFCKVGKSDYRRLAVWTEAKNPEYDFKSILGKNTSKK